jgi:hypothetical protein
MACLLPLGPGGMEKNGKRPVSGRGCGCNMLKYTFFGRLFLYPVATLVNLAENGNLGAHLGPAEHNEGKGRSRPRPTTQPTFQ